VAPSTDAARACKTAGRGEGGRVVFDIGSNEYRLVVAIDYERQTFVNFIGTRDDRIAVERGAT
jgi:mRNA-degrading endonuclease HigB of HigAB toxin-antitoxin module